MAQVKSKPVAKGPLLKGDLSPGALSAELIGTFILAAAILVTNSNVLVLAITIIVLTLTFYKISGAHVNPVMTVALLATRQIAPLKAFGYIVAQILGAMLGLIVVTQFTTSNPQAASLGVEVYKVSEVSGTWAPALAEALGGLVFGLAVAAAVLGKKEGLDRGFVLGGGLLTAILIASLGSAGVINPAVALSVSAYTATDADAVKQWWAVGIYAIAPVVGGIVGAWLYKLMQRDVEGTAKK